MPEPKICVYLSRHGTSSSPSGPEAEVVYETLVLPAMENFPDFNMDPRGYIHEPTVLNTTISDLVLSADLVIADIAELSNGDLFVLGHRHEARLPLVLIGEHHQLLRERQGGPRGQRQ